MKKHDTPAKSDNAMGKDTAADATLRHIEEALRGLRYGSIVVTVQDGVVVQIERTEKTRISR
jgi:hypothetical protein